MSFRSAVLLVLTLLVCLPAAAANEPITCSGIWSSALTEQVLVRTFGRANVSNGMIYLGEGQETPGTVVFARDEKWRLEIVWRDAKRKRSPEWIRIPQGSRWNTFARIRNGMSLAEVEKLNGRAFNLSGFDWDYGGMVMNWRGGRLGALGAACTLHLRFDRSVPDRPTGAQNRAIDQTSGDRELLSSSAALRALSVSVNEIVIQYPE